MSTSLANVSYTMEISPADVRIIYGVESQDGFLIVSRENLKNQIQKIRDILGAYVGLENAQEHMIVRERKFRSYVEWKPREEWSEELEYYYYKDAQVELENARNDFQNVITSHCIIRINKLFNSEQQFQPNF